MAVTLTDFGAYTLTNNANLLTEITFPSGTRGVLVTSETNDTYLQVTGTDGGSLGTHYMQISAGASPAYIPLERSQFGAPPVAYFAHQTSGGTTHLLPVRQRP